MKTATEKECSNVLYSFNESFDILFIVVVSNSRNISDCGKHDQLEFEICAYENHHVSIDKIIENNC
jgi:hypothetical protein